MRTKQQRDDLDLLELTLQLYHRAMLHPEIKQLNDNYLETKQELESRLLAYSQTYMQKLSLTKDNPIKFLIMEWINVKTRLPETDSQHGEDFLSDEVGVWTNEGFSSDKYVRTYDLKCGTGKLLSEGWSCNDDVTHWFQPTKPNDK